MQSRNLEMQVAAAFQHLENGLVRVGRCWPDSGRARPDPNYK